MKNIYFTVGPSQLFPTVKQHLFEAIEQQIGSISHRGVQFEDIFSSAVTRLKMLLSIPEDYAVFFMSSGTESMERTIENVVEKESLHFVNGAFSQRFFDTAIELGKHARKIEVPLGQGFDLQEFGMNSGVTAAEEATKGVMEMGAPRRAPAALAKPSGGGNSRQDPGIKKHTELICFTHNETSTGVMLPAAAIANMKKQYPDKLVAIDTVSSAPYGNIDYKYADIVFFSVQKLFGLPAGLGVMIVSPQALEKARFLQKKGVIIGTYHNFPTLKKWADKNQTAETPSVLHLYLLNSVLSDMLDIGIEKIRTQTEEKAALLYDFFDRHKKWSAFVKNKADRSPTVVVAELGDDQKSVREALKKEGMIVGAGYGPHKNTQIRVANFPAVSKQDIQRLLALLEKYQ